MKKTTVWITAGAIAAALVVSGGGIAIANASDGGQQNGSRLRYTDAEVVADVWDDTDDNANETDRDDTDLASNDQPISKSDRARAEKAALAKAGGGRVTEVDRGDDGVDLWEVDVTRDDGSEVEIELDANFAPTRIDVGA